MTFFLRLRLLGHSLRAGNPIMKWLQFHEIYNYLLINISWCILHFGSCRSIGGSTFGLYQDFFSIGKCRLSLYRNPWNFKFTCTIIVICGECILVQITQQVSLYSSFSNIFATEITQLLFHQPSWILNVFAS